MASSALSIPIRTAGQDSLADQEHQAGHSRQLDSTSQSSSRQEPPMSITPTNSQEIHRPWSGPQTIPNSLPAQCSRCSGQEIPLRPRRCIKESRSNSSCRTDILSATITLPSKELCHDKLQKKKELEKHTTVKSWPNLVFP